MAGTLRRYTTIARMSLGVSFSKLKSTASAIGPDAVPRPCAWPVDKYWASSVSLQAPTPEVESPVMLYARQPAVSAPANFVLVVQCLEQIARRVAVSAMRQRLSQIGTAIPFGTLVGHRLEALLRVEQTRPECHQPALIVWKAQLVFGWNILHRSKCEQIRLDGQHILVGKVGERRVRKCRIEPLPIPGDAFVYGLEEIRIAPGPIGRAHVRRDVRRVNRAERCPERQAASEHLAAFCRVAGLAVGS